VPKDCTGYFVFSGKEIKTLPKTWKLCVARK